MQKQHADGGKGADATVEDGGDVPTQRRHLRMFNFLLYDFVTVGDANKMKCVQQHSSFISRTDARMKKKILFFSAVFKKKPKLKRIWPSLKAFFRRLPKINFRLYIITAFRIRALGPYLWLEPGTEVRPGRQAALALSSLLQFVMSFGRL